MLKFKYYSKIALFSFGGMLMTACQTNYVLTPSQPSEAALVANSFENGLSTELEINYQTAFSNLKQAYGRCVAFTDTDKEIFIFSDNRLEQDLEMGTLFARGDKGVYFQKTTVEGLKNNKTRLTVYLPSNYLFPRTRFKQDVKRALGQDKECNVTSAAN